MPIRKKKNEEEKENTFLYRMSFHKIDKKKGKKRKEKICTNETINMCICMCLN